MIPDIKRILYATDLSENARHAFSYAASIANRYDAKITIVHVVEEFSPSARSQLVAFLGDERWQEILTRKEHDFLETIKQRLDQFCAEMNSAFESCPYIVDDIVIRQGEPVSQIILLAGERNSDLIVMGSHGYGFVAGALIGSTARRVVRRSTTPVMVVRLPDEL